MLNFKQSKVLSEKLMDLGNIAVGTLVFSVVFRYDHFNYWSLVFGTVIAITTYLLALKLEK